MPAVETEGAVTEKYMSQGLWVWSGSGLTSRVPRTLSPLATEADPVKCAQILASESS